MGAKISLILACQQQARHGDDGIQRRGGPGLPKIAALGGVVGELYTSPHADRTARLTWRTALKRVDPNLERYPIPDAAAEVAAANAVRQARLWEQVFAVLAEA